MRLKNSDVFIVAELDRTMFDNKQHPLHWLTVGCDKFLVHNNMVAFQLREYTEDFDHIKTFIDIDKFIVDEDKFKGKLFVLSQCGGFAASCDGCQEAGGLNLVDYKNIRRALQIIFGEEK